MSKKEQLQTLLVPIMDKYGIEVMVNVRWMPICRPPALTVYVIRGYGKNKDLGVAVPSEMKKEVEEASYQVYPELAELEWADNVEFLSAPSQATGISKLLDKI